ncbi:hypothetical protein AAFC00_003594 [Neodothiora populina]|uniref:Uncharacterized protein n=1 Tax=Neodothiora populina TaxID=2781224 RepID=A0ABR3PFW3_9PEZI
MHPHVYYIAILAGQFAYAAPVVTVTNVVTLTTYVSPALSTPSADYVASHLQMTPGAVRPTTWPYPYSATVPHTSPTATQVHASPASAHDTKTPTPSSIHASTNSPTYGSSTSKAFDIPSIVTVTFYSTKSSETPMSTSGASSSKTFNIPSIVVVTVRPTQSSTTATPVSNIGPSPPVASFAPTSAAAVTPQASSQASQVATQNPVLPITLPFATIFPSLVKRSDDYSIAPQASSLPGSVAIKSLDSDSLIAEFAAQSGDEDLAEDRYSVYALRG